MVSAHRTKNNESKVSRQHIEQLEKAKDRRPRYMSALAKAMRTTVEALDELKMPPPLSLNEQREAVRNFSPDQATGKRFLDGIAHGAQPPVGVPAAALMMLRALMEVDPITREAIAPLLANMAKHPEEGQRILQMITGLLAGTSPTSAHDTEEQHPELRVGNNSRP